MLYGTLVVPAEAEPLPGKAGFVVDGTVTALEPLAGVPGPFTPSQSTRTGNSTPMGRSMWRCWIAADISLA